MLEQKIKALVPSGVPTVVGDLPSTASNIVAIRLFDGGANDAYFGTDTWQKNKNTKSLALIN